MNSIRIVKNLINIKTRNYFNGISKIFKIYLNNKIYAAYKLIKLIIVYISLTYIFKMFYKDEYANYVMWLFAFILFLANMDLSGRMVNNIFKPRNVILFQNSKLDEKSISHLFFWSEIIWKKVKEIDLVIPIIIMAVKVRGVRALALIILIELTCLIMVLIKVELVRYKSKKKKGENVNVLSFFITASIISFITAWISKGIIKLSFVFRQYIYSIESFKKNEKQIETILKDKFGVFFTELKEKLNIDLINMLDDKLLILLILIILTITVIFLRKFRIDYSEHEVTLIKNKAGLKTGYLALLKQVVSEEPESFLINKDILIIENDKKLLGKNMIQTVMISYDFFIIIPALFMLRKYSHNTDLTVICIIFGMVSLIFNQINTITSNLEDIFSFKKDIKNIELYKMSLFKVDDVVKAKIKLARYLSGLPFLLIVIISVILIAGSAENMLLTIMQCFCLLVVEGAAFYLAPRIKLYIYSMLMNKNKYVKNLESDEKLDETLHKFCDIPKNMLILPMLYVLIVNVICRAISGFAWRKILLIYLIWMMVIFVIDNLMIVNIRKKAET